MRGTFLPYLKEMAILRYTLVSSAVLTLYYFLCNPVITLVLSPTRENMPTISDAVDAMFSTTDRNSETIYPRRRLLFNEYVFTVVEDQETSYFFFFS